MVKQCLVSSNMNIRRGASLGLKNAKEYIPTKKYIKKKIYDEVTEDIFDGSNV